MKKLFLILISFWGIIAITEAQNNALDFDGSNDYVDCGSMNLSGDKITLECWVNVDAFQSSSPYISTLMGTEEADNIALLRLGDDGLDSNKVQFVLNL